MKHIVLFSGGAASSVAAKIVSEKYGKENTILLHTPTYAEHPDADRFRQQVADYIGLPITIAQDGRSLWQVIEDKGLIPGNALGFCTGELKRIPSEKFYKKLQKEGEEILIYVGFTHEEYRRV